MSPGKQNNSLAWPAILSALGCAAAFSYLVLIDEWYGVTAVLGVAFSVLSILLLLAIWSLCLRKTERRIFWNYFSETLANDLQILVRWFSHWSK